MSKSSLPRLPKERSLSGNSHFKNREILNFSINLGKKGHDFLEPQKFWDQEFFGTKMMIILSRELAHGQCATIQGIRSIAKLLHTL